MAKSRALPVGQFVGLGAGYRDTRTIDVSSEDFAPGYEFTLHIGAPTTAGASTTVVYRTVYGANDVTVTVTDATEVKFMGEVVRLQAVRSSGTTLATGVTLTVGVL